jgi:hypothetical protein
MLQNIRLKLCHRATVGAVHSETELPSGRGTAAGLRAALTSPKGRSPRTGLSYRAAAQFRAATPGRISSNSIEGKYQ